ncbi:hypothetical protein ROP_03470 [Rhodococcus opacus B4]|uniref:Uncharacterized protein n=1 Tax=Rhodococcus opacus (strain B4) TaxID=632772 RepID=C1ARB7_RHOOB|nr:hypothetical protein ROP_03470 [Rhodococcus opacus B4]
MDVGSTHSDRTLEMHTSLHHEASHASNRSGAVNTLRRVPLRNRFVTVVAAAALAVVPVGSATAVAAAPELPATTVSAPTIPGDRGDNGDGPRHDRQRDQRQERRDQGMTLDELLVGWNSSQIHQF